MINNEKNIDYKLFFIIFSLMMFGMIMISSVSIYSSHRVTDVMARAGLIDEAYNHFYVVRNMFHIALSFVFLAFLVKIPYRYFEKYAKYFLGVSILGLITVLIIGPSWNGARGWINLPFLPFAIQPTEFLKFSLIIYLASFFKWNQKKIKSFENGFLPFIAILGVFVVLIGLQPDFGTLMIIIPISIIMFFLAGANVKYLSVLFLLGILLSVGVYKAGEYDRTNPETKNKLSYITDRIDNFLSDKKEAIENKTINYQTKQALIAIGSGGATGLGFGGSIQKFGYLPEVQGDFIFSVIVEELGFLGGFIIVMIYLYIGYKGLYIAYHSKDLFAKYAAAGISSWIVLQAFINIGVNLNIVPLTGITLPFISYGGSSLLSLMLGVALLLNISRYVEINGNRKTRPLISSFNKKKMLVDRKY